jgi:hypothetical protein
MRPVTLDEIATLERYAELRPAYREAVIRHKAARRLPVGEKVTLLFEDHETLRFQVQEMCWIERIREPARVQAELDVYNELLPGENELSATLFVEITDAPAIRPELDRLVGIDEHVSLVLGDERVPARFDPKQLEEERISAVQYIRFALSAEQAARFADPTQELRVRIDHPNYRQEVVLPDALRASLGAGLAGGGTPLLALPPDAAVGRLRDELLFETETVRAYRPAHPRGRDHVVVEPRDPEAGLLEASPVLTGEILAAVRRVAEELSRRHGRCRVETEVGPEAGRPRWHVLALDG